MLLDSLCLGNDQINDNGLVEWCSGRDLFGAEYDMQSADDFVLVAEGTITEVATDYLVFLGLQVDTACLNFHRLPEGGRPERDESCHVKTTNVETTLFSDTLFGLIGERVTARLECTLHVGSFRCRA